MDEPELVDEIRSRTRSSDYEDDSSFKYPKLEDDDQSDSSTADTEIEIKHTSSDTEDFSKLDPSDDRSDSEDLPDDSNISTDQSSSYSILCNRTNLQTQSLSRYAREVIKQFHDLRKHAQRKSIEPIRDANAESDQIKNLPWKGINSLHRKGLLKEGYAVLSDQVFPFYSLCYLCGSMGNDLIYCNSCCEAYHTGCLNECERPQFYPPPDSWLCPNCNLCTICGFSSNSSIIICSDCKKTFHIKCLKSIDDEENVSIRPSRWYCPLCIKCDCGQRLTSNEENLLASDHFLSSMCFDCSTNLKRLQTNPNRKIEKCHLCEKFIEQFIQKPKPLFPLTLIGDQSKRKQNSLLQCMQCKHHFHPTCDGYLNEDVLLVSYLNNMSITIICSKCDNHQSKASLIDYKLQTMKNTIASLTSTLQIIISEENRLDDMKRYLFNLQQLHQSRNQSVNLHDFINDLLIIVQRLLDNLDSRQWQAAIDNCITSQCPWFQRSNLSSSNRTVYCSSVSSTITQTNSRNHHCLPSPSIDHEYCFNNERILFQSNLYKTNLLTSSDSLLNYIDKRFENLHQIDTRVCQLCQTYADHYSSNISRLITIGINRWVHIGCILPAYSQTLDQPPYILRNILEVVHRCQRRYKCEICSKVGASVQCCVNDCHVRFHCQCLETYYYSRFDRSLQEKWKMVNGFLPNLTTYCSKHRINEDHLRVKPINFSSPVYADLSDGYIERPLTDIKLCIGSLQIHSLGDLDYRLDDDPSTDIYPNRYHASRLFWSTKNVQKKTVYHLHIEIEQTYHQERSHHRTITHPLSNEQIRLEELYDKCNQYFNQMKKHVPLRKPGKVPRPSQPLKSVLKNRSNNESMSIDTKTLRNLFTDPSTHSSNNVSQFALALAQALRHADQSISSTNTPLFSYYLPDQSTNEKTGGSRSSTITENFLETSIPQIDGTIEDDSVSNRISSDVLIQLYKDYSMSKFGRRKFTITSNDGYRIVSDDLDQAWLTIVNQIRECRDDMNLTHFSLSNEHFNGHQMFGLRKSIVRTMSLPSSSSNNHKTKRTTHLSFNSRSTIYRRKTSQRHRFNWLSNPHRTIENALRSFEINPALAYARRILLEEPSVSLRLHHLHYFSQHVLLVGSSAIHGCGLFTLIDLVEGQMIIEYTGQVVRPCLTDKRENENEKKGFGCYMFTVDSMNVIDATHQGNQARFINHHCQPNCFAKTVISGGLKHIVIYALVDISQGSELTYDYSFAEEDIKIPCHCGTSNCRMYLN